MLLLEYCAFAIIHTTLRRPIVNGYGSHLSGWEEMSTGLMSIRGLLARLKLMRLIVSGFCFQDVINQDLR